MIGYQVFVLHAHLPYVRHKGYEPQFIEENWLNEAIAETYIPLLQSFRNLKNEFFILRTIPKSIQFVFHRIISFLKDRMLLFFPDCP